MTECEKIVQALRCYANCDKYFKKYGDCYGCPMPYKTEKGKEYQKECVRFEEKYATLSADLIERQEATIKALTGRAEKVEKERDAVVIMLKKTFTAYSAFEDHVLEKMTMDGATFDSITENALGVEEFLDEWRGLEEYHE